MDTTQMILLGLAALVFGSKYVDLGGIWGVIKGKVTGWSEDDPVEDGVFCLVDATSKFVELRECLEHGEKEEALEALDTVWPLMNEGHDE